MAFCPRCGAETPQDARFCANCGQAFGEPSQQTSTQQYAPPPPPGVGLQPGAWRGQRIGLPQYGPNALADPGQRLVARIIDGVIIGVVFVVLVVLFLIPASVTTSVTNRTTGGTTTVGEPAAAFVVLGFIVPFAVFLFYEVGMIAVRGQTLGKMAMGIKVVRLADGQIPGWGPSFVRWIVPAAICFVPFLPLLDVLWLVWDENRQCLHDKAASSLVVRVR
jgi:uncharacterized RDD family membrane protein YckC